METILETQPILGLLSVALAMAIRELFNFLARRGEDREHTILMSQVSGIEQKVNKALEIQGALLKRLENPASNLSTLATHGKLDRIIQGLESSGHKGNK